MKSLVKVLLVVAVLVTTAGQVQATIVYQLNNTISSGGVTGTIQTDGTIGSSTVRDITDWNLIINDGSNTFNLCNTLERQQLQSIDGSSSLAFWDGQQPSV